MEEVSTSQEELSAFEREDPVVAGEHLNLDVFPESALDRITRLAARALSATAAVLTLLEDDDQLSRVSHFGTPCPSETMSAVLDAQVLDTGEVSIIADLPAAAPRGENGSTEASPFRFYAGVPLQVENNPIGILSVLDTEPRSLSDAQLAQLDDLAALAADELALERERVAHAHTERCYHTLFEQASDAILVSSQEGTYIEANAQACALTGYTRVELLDMGPEDLITQRSLDGLPLRWEDRESGEMVILEREIRCKDGSTIPVEVSVRFLGEDLVYAIVRDISERKQKEAEVEALKSFYEEALNQLPVEVAIMDPEGRYQFVNPAAVGDEAVRQWLIGKTAVEYSHYRGLDPEPFEQRLAWIREVVASQEMSRHKETLVLRSGEEKHILRVAVPVFDSDGEVERVFAYGVDLTEQIETQKALRESEHRWYRLVDQHPEPIMISIDGEIVYANQASADVFGAVAPEEIIGYSVFDFMTSELREAMEKRKARVEAGTPTDPFEHTITRLDGQKRTVVSLSVPVIYEGQRAAQTVIRDVTDRKRREEELRRAKEQAEEMSRLKSAFLANMSHEIRTPLTSILGFADVLAEYVEGEAHELVDVIRRSGDRLQRTLTSVLDLARLESQSMNLQLETLDVAREVRETTDVLSTQACAKGLALHLNLPETSVPAKLDSGALTRILSNLISNAIKFTEIGSVTVGLDATDDQVEIRVQDTGVGISDEFLEQIFDEFKQESVGLARDYEGTGLGLTITKRLVDLMEGTIQAESKKGRGSTFIVRLPRHLDEKNEPDDGEA